MTFNPENPDGQAVLFVAQRVLEKAVAAIDPTAIVEHPALNVNGMQSSGILADGMFVSRQQEMTGLYAELEDARFDRGRLGALMREPE